MRIRSKQVLLDANVIIKAHEIDVWNALLREVDVAVTSIIAHDESLFFSKEAELVPAPINITALIQQGAIPELSASVSDIERVRAVFDEELNMALHDGEVESHCHPLRRSIRQLPVLYERQGCDSGAGDAGPLRQRRFIRGSP